VTKLFAVSHNALKPTLFYGAQTQQQHNQARQVLTTQLPAGVSANTYKHTLKLLALEVEDNAPVSERLIRKALKEHGIRLTSHNEQLKRNNGGALYMERMLIAEGHQLLIYSRDRYPEWRQGWNTAFSGRFGNNHKVPPEDARTVQAFLKQKVGFNAEA
jgi:hypothetical protein